MSVRCVPYKQLSVELVSCRNQKLIVVGECEVLNGIVMLTEPVDSFLSIIIPNNYVGVVAFLACYEYKMVKKKVNGTYLRQGDLPCLK